MDEIRKTLIEGAMSVGALKFGTFTLKSGRVSPYFINAGLLCTGPLLDAVASSYASLIASQFLHQPQHQHQHEQQQSPAPPPPLAVDVLFGPAYKGIPFAAATALALYRDHNNISVGIAYDRKEAKDHGEGGRMVGAAVHGQRVLVLDDVMTAGTAVRQSIDLIHKEGGIVVGVVMLLDREEVTVDGRNTVSDIEAILHDAEGSEDGSAGTQEKRVHTILRLRDLMAWLESNGRTDVVQQMQAYRDQYGVKN